MLINQQTSRNTKLIFSEVEPKDYKYYKLLKNYKQRAIYCGEDGHIFLETNCNYYKEICDFLTAIAEPLHRTKNMHEYSLTENSLYSASSMNIKTDLIILILNNICKHELPQTLINFIKENTERYGKAKLVLEKKRYFIECYDYNIKNYLYRDSVLELSNRKVYAKRNKNSTLPETSNPRIITIPDIDYNNENDINNNLSNAIKEMMGENKENDNKERPSNGETFFEVDAEDIEEIRKRCKENLNYPLLEEYDFNNDNLPELNIRPKLKNPTRGYQEKALSIMFSNQRARSGIIVLPCGAGKTLVGILATTTIKRSTVILCNSSVSVEQWHKEINTYTIVKPKENVVRFTGDKKDPLWNLDKEAGILISTYSMMSQIDKKNPEVKAKIKDMNNTEWGLMIFDEVQVLPAKIFREILAIFKSHCKLGLTATLVREDTKIKDLHFLIGPKHYEANWLDLQREGYLARVKCVEIWCEMEDNFYKEYLKSDASKRKRLYTSNPNKFYVCKALINKYKGSKIIIYSNDLLTFDYYAKELKCLYIYGTTPNKERNAILSKFEDDLSGYDVLLMSQVGDTSLNIPNVKVIIQVSSHFGSRRQEAQRLGRVLRPKKDISEFNAYFYTIISKNTEEMYFSNKRHQYLIDQGYYFEVITDWHNILNTQNVKIDNIFNKKVLYDILAKIERGEKAEELSDNEDVLSDKNNIFTNNLNHYYNNKMEID